MRCSLAASSSRSTRAPLRYVQSASVSAGCAASTEGLGAPKTPRGGVAERAATGEHRFGLLVDSEYYGPFAHVAITPCVVPGTSENVTLPLGTFFHIDEDGTAD